MASYDGQMYRMPSGDELTASEMVRGVLELASNLEFDRILLGFPGLVEYGKPALEPRNLGTGWVDFDYSKAFGKPMRCINDAAMQALGNYRSGRLLFLGLGTSIGATVIVDDVVVPIDVGRVKLTPTQRLIDRLSKVALRCDGREHWVVAVLEAVELLQDVFRASPRNALFENQKIYSENFARFACDFRFTTTCSGCSRVFLRLKTQI